MKKTLLILFCGLSVLLISACNSSSPETQSSETPNYSSNYYSSYSPNYNSTPSSNVNDYKETAITPEEADNLRGTGYHNTRPNSSAEDIELSAAQVKCKQCGYHSDNGVNSLCDSCQAKGN